MALEHAAPGQAVDLSAFGEKIKDARTTAIVKSESFEAIRLVVHAGTEIPPHSVSGRMTLHCLEGKVVLGLPDDEVELDAGAWLYLDRGEVHSVKGILDSSLLLTIMFEG